MKTIGQLRAAFGRCSECAAKQIGLRALRDAAYFAERNPAFAAERRATAEFQLPYAQEITRRGL